MISLEQIITNLVNMGIYAGVAIDVADGKVTIHSLSQQLVQFPVDIFPEGVSLQDRVLITKCFKTKKVSGIILPPMWWKN